jgi:hypothetical protein
LTDGAFSCDIPRVTGLASTSQKEEQPSLEHGNSTANGACLRCLILSILSAILLPACSTAPLLLDATHPASVDAPEASATPARRMLGIDERTARTRKLLAERRRQAEAAESEQPADTANLKPAAPVRKEGHEHH